MYLAVCELYFPKITTERDILHGNNTQIYLLLLTCSYFEYEFVNKDDESRLGFDNNKQVYFYWVDDALGIRKMNLNMSNLSVISHAN